MQGVRISIRMGFDKPFYLNENYKQEISLNLKRIGIERFVFSDLICKRRKSLDNGFYAIDEARFDVSTIYNKETYKKIARISKEGIKIENQKITNLLIEIRKINYFSSGYLLSPALVLNEEGESIYFADNPVIYSQAVKKKLIKKYKEILGIEPKDQNFVILFRKLPEKIVCENKILIKSKFEMYGSEELIYLENVLGIGDNNEEGYGMISDSLYFYKKDNT